DLGAGHRVVGHRASQRRKRRDGRLVGIAGHEHLHVMIDDHSRLAYAEVLAGLTAGCAIAFLRRAVAWFAERGVAIRAVMTDNGSAYTSRSYAAALVELQNSDTSARAPTAHAQTAKPNASSRRCSRSG